MPPLPMGGITPLPAGIISMPWGVGISMKPGGGMASGVAGGAPTAASAAMRELESAGAGEERAEMRLTSLEGQRRRARPHCCAPLHCRPRSAAACHPACPPAPTVGCTLPSPLCALLLTMLGLTVAVGPLMLVVVVGPVMLRVEEGVGTQSAAAQAARK